MIRQTIVTKYLGPTDFRGSRVKATCQAGSVTIPWSHELDSEENHLKAATALAWKYGWLDRGEKLVGVGMPDGRGNCYVLVMKGEKP